MPRRCRVVPDGYAFHVINRGNRRQTIFHQRSDYEEFLDLMARAQERVAMRIIAATLMTNHFHLVLWPYAGVALSAYMAWLMNAHVRHHQAVYGLRGTGHVYQGRFKSFVIQDDVHLINVMRYVEANPVRAGCVESADQWEWSSLGRRFLAERRNLLSPSPVARSSDWLTVVNAPLPTADLVDLRTCVSRNRPYGHQWWLDEMVARYDLGYTIRSVGRPRRAVDDLSPV